MRAEDSGVQPMENLTLGTLTLARWIPPENPARAIDDFVKPRGPHLRLCLRVDPFDLHLVIRIHMDAGADVEKVAYARMKREAVLEALVPGFPRLGESGPSLACAASARRTVSARALGALSALRRASALRRTVARRRLRDA